MERNYTIDALRTIAALLVVLLHCSASYMYAQTNDLNFWGASVINAFTRVSVPIFVLISGSFLLGRVESLKVFFKKRASRVLIPLIFWSVFYLIYKGFVFYFMTGSFPFKELKNSIIFGDPFYHLWYLYMLLGLYLVTPFLNLFIQSTSRRSVWILAVGLTLLGIVNTFYDTIYHNKPFFMLWFIPYLGYFLLGYLFKDFKVKRPYLPFLIYIVLSLLMVASLRLSLEHFTAPFYGYNNLTPLVILASLSFYVFFSNLKINKGLLSKVSHLTFGVYLVHALILDFLLKFFKMDYFQDYDLFNNAFVMIPIRFVLVSVLSFLVTYCLSKIKYLRKTI